MWLASLKLPSAVHGGVGKSAKSAGLRYFQFYIHNQVQFNKCQHMPLYWPFKKVVTKVTKAQRPGPYGRNQRYEKITK